MSENGKMIQLLLFKVRLLYLVFFYEFNGSGTHVRRSSLSSNITFIIADILDSIKKVKNLLSKS